MRYDFRSAANATAGYDVLAQVLDSTGKPKDPFGVFADRDNFVQDDTGVHLYCRNFAGAGFMLMNPKQYGLWQVRSRATAGIDLTHTTKVCDLLWEANGDWKTNFGEVDFNESGDRTISNQTEHFPPDNKMHHTHYDADQLTWHTYGVEMSPASIRYFYDGVQQGEPVVNEHGPKWWNPHMRAEPRDDMSETRMDVRWVEVPD